MQNQSTTVTVVEDEVEKKYEYHPLDEFWTEHRTTLISYETQFVSNLKPEQEQEETEGKKSKSKKKNIEYEGGFLFPGKPGDKQENITQTIMNSKYTALKELFQEGPSIPKDTIKLRQFVRIMLQLKHNSIIREFLQIYEMIIQEMKEVKFQSIRLEPDRFRVVERIMNKVTDYVQKCAYLFTHFTKYLKENSRETTKFFKVTAYCFLAEKYNFSINEFYCEAFDIQEEGKIPKKKKKLEQEEEGDC